MKEKIMIKNSSVGCNIDLKIYNKQHGKNMHFVLSGVGFTPECVWNTAPYRDSFVWWHVDRNEICNDPCLLLSKPAFTSSPLWFPPASVCFLSSPLTQDPMYYLYLNANFTALDLLPAAQKQFWVEMCASSSKKEKYS